MSRRHLSLLACAAAALAVWYALPASGIDRVLFSLTAKAFAKPESFTSGKGTHAEPFALLTFRDSPPDITGKLPVDIAFSEGSESFFESSPPSPSDIAVVLMNLRRMGRDSVAIAMPMTWPDPGILALTALEQQLDAFSTVITSAPLSRKPEPSPIPPAFRRASVPLFSIEGNSQLLPMVNHLPVPDLVLGNANSLAGFTTLESEETNDHPYLLARWDDRAVLSFHLLAALGHFDAKPSAITVRLGKWISFGPDGPYIPIDEYGRLSLRPPELPPGAASTMPAETLIDAPDDSLAASPTDPALLRSALSAADPVAAAYSESLAATVALLSDPEGTSRSQHFPCMPWLAELLLIGSVLSLLQGFRNYPSLSGKRPLVILAGLLLVLHFILVPATSTWLATAPLIACALAAIPFSAAIEPTKTAIPPAKHTPAQKAPAKKSAKKAARKTPAKKSPGKRKPR